MVDFAEVQDKTISIEQKEQKLDSGRVKSLWDTYNRNWYKPDHDQWPIATLYGMGREVLKETSKIAKDESVEKFTLSRLFSSLAEEDDRSLLLRIMSGKDVVEDPDGSSKSNFFEALNRLNIEVRQNDPSDKRLSESAQVIISMFENIGNVHSKHNALVSLSVIGTSEAKNFAEKHGIDDDIAKYFEDVNNVPTRVYERDKIVDDEESMYTESDYERKIQFRGKTELEEYIETATPIMDETEKIIESLAGLEDTAREACLLYTYNFLRKYPELTNEGRKFLIEKLTRLNKQEKLYMQNDVPLPPLGIEVEIPETSNRQMNEFVLQCFGVSHYDEGDLLEINKAYSYSGEIQSRVLEEVAKMGAIPLVPGEKGLGDIPREVPLSLHMNFGLPSELDNNDDLEDDYLEDFQALVNWVTYAFTSPDRISKRKTRSSWYMRPGKTEASNKSGKQRLEIRVSEFKDFSSFRMIDEAQKLTGALFSYLKKMNGHKLSHKESRMSELWINFKRKVNQTMNNYSVRSMLFDRDSDEAAEIASNEKLRSEMRQISRIQSKEITKTVFPNK